MFAKLLKKFSNSYFMKNYRSVYPYAYKYKTRALLAIFATLPVGMLDTAIPWALKNYIDMLSGQQESFFRSYLPLMIVMFSILQSVFTYLSTYLNAWVGAKISNELKFDLFNKLMRCDTSFFDNNVSGTIQIRFNGDADAACAGLLNNIKMFFTRVFNAISLIVVLLIISWRLAMIAILVLVFSLYPLTTIRKKITDIVSASVKSGSTIANHYLETFAGYKIVASYNLYAYQLKKFVDALEFAFKCGMKMMQRTGMLSPIMHFVIGTGIAIILFAGDYMISNKLLTVGGFVAFITSVVLLYQPIKSLGNDLTAVETSFLAMERVFTILNDQPIIKNDKNGLMLKSINNSIEYRDVKFSYANKVQVLNGINLSVKIGDTVAFVGSSGGGKTTLMNLLPRFYDVTSGGIFIDGIDIRKFNIDSLRDKIAIVFQDNFLFSGSILDNILLGKIDASKSEIEKAIDSACLTDFINSLENGLDTEIGERGAMLSGGQKQRVAIARAFIKNAPIVILDEATSALDNKSEAIVQKAINNLMQDRTVFIIAHRLSTVKNANKIVVVNHGEIVEIGTHEHLISLNGTYSSLYSSQFK